LRWSPARRGPLWAFAGGSRSAEVTP